MIFGIHSFVQLSGVSNPQSFIIIHCNVILWHEFGDRIPQKQLCIFIIIIFHITVKPLMLLCEISLRLRDVRKTVSVLKERIFQLFKFHQVTSTVRSQAHPRSWLRSVSVTLQANYCGIGNTDLIEKFLKRDV